MNVKQLKDIIAGLEDDAAVAILMPDGTLDYATGGWVEPDITDDGDPNDDAGTVVISGN